MILSQFEWERVALACLDVKKTFEASFSFKKWKGFVDSTVQLTLWRPNICSSSLIFVDEPTVSRRPGRAA